MSLLEPTLTLTYLDGSEPRHYSIKIELDSVSSGGATLLTHQGIPEEPAQGNTFEIVIDTIEEEGTEELIIDLGELPLDPVEGEIEVILHDVESQVIGRNNIHAEEAQKESRPIGDNF